MFPIKINQINVKNNKDHRTIFNDAHFSVDKGDFIFLSGKNHSGKTTLLNILNANPIDGMNVTCDIECENEILTSSKIGNFKRKISFVEQNDEFYLDTPFDELKMEYLKFEDEINEDEIDEYLNIFEISHLKYKKFKKNGQEIFSGGEKRKLSIIKGLLKKNIELFVIDEPFNNLDIPSIIKVVNILYNIHLNYNLTIIVTSHFNLFLGVNKVCTINDSVITCKKFSNVTNGISWYIKDNEIIVEQYSK